MKFLKKFKMLAIINWYKVRRCRLNKHLSGAHILIEKTYTGDWEESRSKCLTRIRPMTGKFVCEKCQTIFLHETWDYEFTNE